MPPLPFIPFQSSIHNWKDSLKVASCSTSIFFGSSRGLLGYWFSGTFNLIVMIRTPCCSTYYKSCLKLPPTWGFFFFKEFRNSDQMQQFAIHTGESVSSCLQYLLFNFSSVLWQEMPSDACQTGNAALYCVDKQQQQDGGGDVIGSEPAATSSTGLVTIEIYISFTF